MDRPPVRAPAQDAVPDAAWLDEIETAAAEVFGFMLAEKLKRDPIVLDVIESPGARQRRLKGEW